MRVALPLVLAVAAALATGCTPTCQATCKKLLSCDEELDLAGQTEQDCETYCEAQQQLYEDDWDDPDIEQAFDDMKSCIRAEDCEAIADGVCYDDDLYLW